MQVDSVYYKIVCCPALKQHCGGISICELQIYIINSAFLQDMHKKKNTTIKYLTRGDQRMNKVFCMS